MVNLHPHYVFWTTVPEYSMGHSCSFGPDSFVEPGIDVHIWSSHLLHGKFPDLSECPWGRLLETHLMGVLVNADGVFSGHYLTVGRSALVPLATLLLRSHSAGPRLERKSLCVFSFNFLFIDFRKRGRSRVTSFFFPTYIFTGYFLHVP